MPKVYRHDYGKTRMRKHQCEGGRLTPPCLGYEAGQSTNVVALHSVIVGVTPIAEDSTSLSPCLD